MATSIFDYASFVWDGRLVGRAPGKLFPLKPNVKDLTGDFLTVTRTTSKWVLGSNGVLTEVAANTPAIEYNTDGTYRGLLVEPAATNLALRSQEFDNVVWGKLGTGTGLAPVVTANDAVAPNGTLTADRIDFDRGAGNLVGDNSQISQSVTVVASTDYTSSVYIKAATPSDVGKQIGIRSQAVTYSVYTLTSEWQRITNTGQFSTTTGSIALVSRGTITVDNAVSVHVWQGQLELGRVATSIIPTVASTANRTADSVTLTGASSLIGQTEGTMYCEFQPRSSGVDNRGVIEVFIDASNVRRIKMNLTGGVDFRPATAGVGTTLFTTTQNAITTVSRVAVAYADSNTSMFFNGTQVGADNTTYVYGAGSYSGAVLGTGSAGPLNGWIRSAVLFPSRLTNTKLQSLTS